MIFFVLFFAVHAIFKVSQRAANIVFNAVPACRTHKADQHHFGDKENRGTNECHS